MLSEQSFILYAVASMFVKLVFNSLFRFATILLCFVLCASSVSAESLSEAMDAIGRANGPAEAASICSMFMMEPQGHLPLERIKVTETFYDKFGYCKEFIVVFDNMVMSHAFCSTLLPYLQRASERFPELRTRPDYWRIRAMEENNASFAGLNKASDALQSANRGLEMSKDSWTIAALYAEQARALSRLGKAAEAMTAKQKATELATQIASQYDAKSYKGWYARAVLDDLERRTVTGNEFGDSFTRDAARQKVDSGMGKSVLLLGLLSGGSALFGFCLYRVVVRKKRRGESTG